MKLPGPDHPITITANPKRIRVTADGVVIAETTHALTLKEASYPAVQYVPRDDANMALLARTERVTHCPYKGDASYFSIAAGGNAEIARIALVGAVRHPLGARQQRHIGVVARHILHRRIACFLQRQGMGGFGNHDAVGSDADPLRVRRNCDGVVGTGEFHGRQPFRSARCDRGVDPAALQGLKPEYSVTARDVEGCPR